VNVDFGNKMITNNNNNRVLTDIKIYQKEVIAGLNHVRFLPTEKNKQIALY